MNRKWIGIILAIAIFITLIPAVMAPAQAYGDVFSSVSTGTYHAVAVKADGSLWTWGWNYEGELADGTTTDRYVPTKVMDNVMTASAGWHHTAIIKTDGSLWECGSSWHDSTCDETGANRYAPVKIMDDAKAVSSGDNYNAAIKTDGSLWVWGWRNGRCCHICRILPQHGD